MTSSRISRTISPVPLNWEKVNVIRLDVESDDSGVDSSTARS